METVNIMEKTRIDKLRAIAFDNGHHPNNGVELEYLTAKAYLETGTEQFHNLRRAKIDCAIFDNYNIEVTPGELLAGRFSHDTALTAEQEELRRKGSEAIKNGGVMSGYAQASTGHRVLDYEKLLNKGAKSILAQIEEKLSAIDYSKTDDAEKALFYQSSKISLEGLCRFACRFHDQLLTLADRESDSVQKAEYLRMAKNFEKAPYEPCTGFYEALQIVWFCQFSLNLLADTSLAGRADNYLYPFYKSDIEKGLLTPDEAYELIVNFYCKQNEIYDTWPGSLMVGGVDRQNRPVWNELSEMFINAIETTGLINPSVSVAYTKDMPPHLLDTCVDIISKGYTKPSIFNDRIVRKGLEDAGVNTIDAREYIHSTCVEITPIACSNIQVATPYINPTKALEYVLGRGRPLFGEACGLSKDIIISEDDFEDFDSFYTTVKNVMAEIIRKAMIDDCYYALQRKRYHSSPLSSALINDCIELGMDAGAGGAKYNFIYPCFPGYVTLVDSMAAIKTAVFDEKKLTLNELAGLCATNFKDEERMRLYLVNRCAKFGNDDDSADAIGKDFYDFLRTELTKYRHCLGKTATFHPSYFAWIQHGRLGKIAAATPNGRKQGEALSENLGASQGMDRNSPLGVVRSISKLDQSYGIGGIATNFRFSQSFAASAEGKRALVEFIKYFMDQDCFEIQFNVVDQAVLLDAKANPEKYATLMVRVAGYSDYFTNLAPEIQDEIILRTEHNAI
ncbi:pyruvate formate lyase family protein [Leadbettera azotonutricia]|uniref:Putative formate C-acetyltransferase n=1 Tax=Leadbettera azotonutricia (strain ATCC BAA-888 / DSM 13862 / ZAS-9) TaxID=545695 RepID=F5YF08_LEAAZ|nr:pyruvate formate lyase family protein [Leadbettera azotonutricia]AEF80835.1 putative formate C-acetyltransferase [Leadbettera azotonutricia ZAS-9]